MAKDLFSKLESEHIKRRDFSLIKATLNGNKIAFARLMKYYKTKVFLFGKSFFRNETDAEDLVQDVFIKVYLNLSSFKGNSLFSTWLMRIAYNTAINSVNSKKNYLSIAENFDFEATEATPEEVQIKKITIEAIREAIKELPEKYSVCIDMYFSYDISYQDISEITGFPINTIKSHIFRAKKILKNKLEEYYGK